MNKCIKLQKEKRSLEMQIRVELDNWRTRAKKGAPTTECRHRLSIFLKGFKVAQEAQDILIEKEKLAIKNFENEYSKAKVLVLKSKLKFFAMLNKQHEKLLEMVRQDVLDCRSICRQNYESDDSNDARIRCVALAICVARFFNKEPSSRPSSKRSYFFDFFLSNSSTKSS